MDLEKNLLVLEEKVFGSKGSFRYPVAVGMGA